MIRKPSYSVTSDYILVILLLIFSGNPIATFLDKTILFVIAILILVVKYKEVKKDFFPKFCLIVAGLLVLFILQYFTLHFQSWLGALRYMALFLFGGLIIHLVGERFCFRFFVVIYYVSLISIFLFFVINLLNIHVPGLVWGKQRLTFLVYTFVEEHHYRNSGMFWEPGAFAGILTLCMALNVKDMPELWKNHKFKIFVIIVALLTTKSTTGYITFFIIAIFSLTFFMRIALIKVLAIPAIFFSIFVVYESVPFLQDKIKAQFQKNAAIVPGQFTNSRFGSFVLDMHYIKKHPLVGNGLNEITRYADDPLVLQQIQAGVNIANANGFSNFLACLGIPFMVIYLLSCFTAMGKVDLRVAFLVVFVIVLSLWGEQWLNFPIFTGMMFLNIKSFSEDPNASARKYS